MTFDDIRSGLLKLSHSNFVVDYEDYFIGKKYRDSPQIEIPAIIIYYNKDGESCFSKSIFDLFERDQYLPLIISDDTYEINRYNAIPLEYYLENKEITSKTLCLIDKIYKPGIMIFSVCETNCVDNGLFDVALYHEGNQIILKNQNGRTKITGSVEEVYTHILEIYDME